MAVLPSDVLKPGDKAPAFALLDQAVGKVKLSDFKGRKVLVYFYPSVQMRGGGGISSRAR